MLFSKNGIIPWDIPDVFVPNYIITLPKIIIFFESLGIQESTTILTFKIAFIVLCVFIILGLFSRISAFLLLFLQISMVKGMVFFAYGVDFFTSMSLFYLIIFPTDNAYSIKSLLLNNTQKVNLTPLRRLFQLHICIAYFFSGFGKALGFNWWNGESIWKAINLPYSNRDFNFDFSLLIEHSYILIIIGWSTIIIEMLYPIFIWIPETRKIWLLLVVSMHLGITIVLNLYYFSAILIIWNITTFYFSEKKREEKKLPLQKIRAANTSN